MHVVEVEGVSKSFGGTDVIRDISFSVEKGEIFGLLGPNGAGKTTLIRMLLDIIRPDSGEIRVFGASLDPAGKDRIGYLPEERGLYRKTKLVDMLVYLAQLKNVSGKQARVNAESLLRSLGLYEHRGKKVEELSKGMQQKIQFLSSIIHYPDLVVLDEPFSGLDPVSTKTVKERIIEYRNAGKTVILSTHMMEQAQTLCDRILVVDRGRRVLYGSVEGIRKERGKNSLLVEFAGYGSGHGSGHGSEYGAGHETGLDVVLDVGSGAGAGTGGDSLSVLRGIPGVRRIVEHEEEHKKFVEIFPEEGAGTQAILEELVRRVEVLRFEQALPSLNEIFIDTVEANANE
ncbi:ABC transporter, ATP-binding protein [Methanosarcina sp. MTP4]|uniref:ABC transporter ATP-binding protein n=1 Tax=Methanosarcina sp. MTP4 TaxID=1434100 RepID=UPI000615AB53|nr:ATP-binding cassette domain-containing protein [Methanosarcina sp. MTP4]AKB23750.1 ABC transporter, ATP-binding protein [Methanosarcina sp. MTP4]